MTELHVFQAGTWQSMHGQAVTLSAADVQAAARAYDPARHEAPIVIGHPATDAPAHGWVKRLREEAGGLFAEVEQVSPELREMVRAGRYRKISSSFMGPDAQGNPTPGVWHLRHVGFLGAVPPAVKGLRQADLAAGDADAVMFSARSASASFAERQLAQRDSADLVEELFRKGIVTPAMRPLALALLESADADLTIDLAEHDGTTRRMDQVAAVKALLRSMPVSIHFGELAAASGDDRIDPFEAPFGMSVSAAREDLRRRAMAYAREHKVDFRTAVQALER